MFGIPHNYIVGCIFCQFHLSLFGYNCVIERVNICSAHENEYADAPRCNIATEPNNGTERAEDTGSVPDPAGHAYVDSPPDYVTVPDSEPQTQYAQHDTVQPQIDEVGGIIHSCNLNSGNFYCHLILVAKK